MEHYARPRSVIETLGEEIVRIVTPVSICMLLVVILVSVLNGASNFSYGDGVTVNSVATMAYSENGSDSIWDKLKGALLNSLIFVAVVTVVTFLLVLLFYLRCTKFLKYYMGFSAFMVLGFMGGEIVLQLIRDFSFPIDCITFLVILFNLSVIGVMAVFMTKMAIFITQSYLVAIGMLVAYWFTLLPEWTTWVLLVAMALYDLAAVLLPGGPLRLLVELAISRDEDIPALVYEARPVLVNESSTAPTRIWRNGRGDLVDNQNQTSSRSNLSPDSSSRSHLQDETPENDVEEGVIRSEDPELMAPLIQNVNAAASEDLFLEGIGLGSSGAIKLGLGDFIFYSVLVGRAAMYDFMTVYACYLAIIAGLGLTLILLAVYRKALPALPVSVMLGVIFYLLTRFSLEVFVVQCSIHLVMF